MRSSWCWRSSPVAGLAPWLIPWVFGERFADSVPILQVLCLLGVLQGVGLALGSMFLVLRRVVASLIIKLACVALVLPAGILVTLEMPDPALAVAAYMIAQTTLVVLVAHLYLRRLRRS